MEKEEIDILLTKIQNGELRAFEEFYNKTYKKIYEVIYAILLSKEAAEDVEQDVYIKVYEKISSYKSGTNGIAWLYRIAQNSAFNEYRKRKKTLTVEELSEIPCNGENMEWEVESKISFISLMRNVNGLDREIIYLHLIAGYTFKEVATIMKLSLPNVKWHYASGLKKIKRALEKKSISWRGEGINEGY